MGWSVGPCLWRRGRGEARANAALAGRDYSSPALLHIWWVDKYTYKYSLIIYLGIMAEGAVELLENTYAEEAEDASATLRNIAET